MSNDLKFLFLDTSGYIISVLFVCKLLITFMSKIIFPGPEYYVLYLHRKE